MQLPQSKLTLQVTYPILSLKTSLQIRGNELLLPVPVFQQIKRLWSFNSKPKLRSLGLKWLESKIKKKNTKAHL